MGKETLHSPKRHNSMEPKELFTLIVFLIFYISLVAESSLAPYWNDLRVTVGSVETEGEESCSGTAADGSKSDKLFRKLGRIESELRAARWNRLDPDAKCENSGLFNGFQWIDPSEPLSYALLLDIQGTIAGIQLFVPYHDVLRPGQNYKYGESPMIQNVTIRNVPYFYVTAYFIEPCLICSTGRSPSALASQGTGTGVYLQNGPNPLNIMRAPLSREKATKEFYEKNNCWKGMGWHAYYKQSDWNKDECTTFRPEFMMYDNEGELRAFGFVVTGNVTAPAMERPGPVISEAISGRPFPGITAPKCLTDLSKAFGLSTLHVFFTERPWEFKCSFPYQMNAYISGANYVVREKLG